MLTTFIVGMIALAICTAVFFYVQENNYGFIGLISFFMSAVSVSSLLVGAVVAVFLSFSWFSSEHKANIINREYQTNYTQEEVFYASNVIDTIREIQRNRNEITLNVNTQKKENK